MQALIIFIIRAKWAFVINIKEILKNKYFLKLNSLSLTLFSIQMIYSTGSRCKVHDQGNKEFKQSTYPSGSL